MQDQSVDGAAQVSIINTLQQQVPAISGDVKTRTEVLAGQKYERSGKRGSKRSRKRQGGEEGDPNCPKAQMKKQIKEFYAKHGCDPQFETKGG